MQDIGNRIKKIRKLLNKSQEELALELGLTKQAISNIENSKSLPSISLLSKLLVNFDVNLNYVIGGKDSYFVSNQNDYSKLKNSLMKEVEEFLDSKGIR